MKESHRRTIKVGYSDFLEGHQIETDRAYLALSKFYDVQICDDPDYLICSVFGWQHLRHDSSIKILIHSENFTPDFNLFDYAIGFDDLSFGDRYARIPNYQCYPAYYELPKRDKECPTDEALLHRGFCSMVVSNPNGDPNRMRFFEALSKYKKVDSGGRFSNNVGSPVSNKLEFCSKYKFNIAFENSASAGYTTEKLMEPLVVHSVPLYYGNPEVGRDFNTSSFVQIHLGSNGEGLQEAVDRVVALDKDDDAYLKICRSECLLSDPCELQNRFENFLCHIIDQPLEYARRVCNYGYQRTYRDWLASRNRFFDMTPKFLHNIVGKFVK